MKSRVYTGRDSELIDALKADISGSGRVKIIVSFIMESGVKLLEKSLREALENGAKIQIITGTYMGITEPSALYLLKDILGDFGSIRIYQGKDSFHPKGYFIEDQRGKRLYVGSSNISHMGLVKGLEWNYMVEDQVDSLSLTTFESTFDELFRDETKDMDMEFLRKYASGWRRSSFIKAVDQHEPEVAETGADEFIPRGIQLEALYELDRARNEGIEKGLVVSATGSGKTYIGAFDVRQSGAKTALFVAHREEILNQALESFKNIHPHSTASLFNGREKNHKADFVFASVQTLGRKEHLNEKTFRRDAFDYIIIDEFHHAAADSYRGILEYFQPKFMLGLTATPYRMDNKDILCLCENNVIYELSLHAAINRDVLCPFRYLGVYDLVDYSGFGLVNGKYATDDLEKAYGLHERSEEVFRRYKDYGGECTLGFCVSIRHAEAMAEYFRKRGIKAEAVHSRSEEGKDSREDLILRFRRKEIRVLFTVDIFNEGVDIPEVDTVMFLRPTESYVVFLQQLGRGLRKSKDKKHLTVIDFIGNYKRAHYKPLLLAGRNPLMAGRTSVLPDHLVYPEGCIVTFDLRVLDLFKEMRRRDPKRERLLTEYRRIEAAIGQRPMREDLLLGSDIDHKEFMKEGYLKYLQSVQALNANETKWLGTAIEAFLIRMERTGMSRSYKLPILWALIDGGGCASYDLIGETFMDFYINSRRRLLDLEQDKQNSNWGSWDRNHFLKRALEMPVRFLSQTEKEFINHDVSNGSVSFSSEIMKFWNDDLRLHLKDILSLREKVYYSRGYFIENGEKY